MPYIERNHIWDTLATPHNPFKRTHNHCCKHECCCDETPPCWSGLFHGTCLKVNNCHWVINTDVTEKITHQQTYFVPCVLDTHSWTTLLLLALCFGHLHIMVTSLSQIIYFLWWVISICSGRIFQLWHVNLHLIIILRWILVYRHALRHVTKIRACKGASQKWNPRVTFHVLRSLGKCEGMNPHTPKWAPTLGVVVSMDFRIFKGRLQGSELIGLKSSLYY
jgi:hypothetical protein